ncbi:MAG: transposase [Pirellulales bacterium]|nr:transposase [Pirellulales bacterium]
MDHPRAKEIVIDLLAEELAKRQGGCFGFVVMPDHVHATVWFRAVGCLSEFMKVWKGKSSRELKLLLRGTLPEYTRTIDLREPCWQPKYYAFNVYSESKVREKLEYMHMNPVRAGLVELAINWEWSSARYYELGEPCEVPLAWEF